jgi:hypothetical protein
MYIHMVGTYPTHDWMLTAITSKVTRYRKHIAILVLELRLLTTS